MRFRFPTEALVAAANAERAMISIGMVQVEITGAPLADFREFAARMNPNPLARTSRGKSTKGPQTGRRSRFMLLWRCCGTRRSASATA